MGLVRARLIAAGIVIFLLTGCGNARTQAPQVGAPALPAGFRALHLPGAGASLSVPRNWALLGTHSNVLLVLDTSGGAVIALWRYPLAGAAPRSPQQLRLALQRLIASARGRSHSLKVNSSGVTRIAGRPALTLDTDQHIGHRERRLISTHVFGPSEELVLEEYAPPHYFPAVDRDVFVSVLHSLTFSAR